MNCLIDLSQGKYCASNVICVSSSFTVGLIVMIILIGRKEDYIEADDLHFLTEYWTNSAYSAYTIPQCISSCSKCTFIAAMMQWKYFDGNSQGFLFGLVLKSGYGFFWPRIRGYLSCLTILSDAILLPWRSIVQESFFSGPHKRAQGKP